MSFDFGGKRVLVTGAGKGERFSMRMCWIGNCRVCMGTLAVARLYKVFHHTKGVWDMATEQFVAPHRGVHTNHSAVFSHTIPEVCD